jgi:hypothetical protein
MGSFLDRKGKRYGKLLVINHCGKDNRNFHLWNCKCDCGNTKVVVGSNLSSGKSKSCGCLKIEFLAKKGNQFGLYEDRQDAMLKVQYSHLKRRNNKMIGKIIDFENFIVLSKSECKYCGLKHSKEIKDRTNEKLDGKLLSSEILLINGIDRLDSSLGYTEQNTVSCCKNCNFAKNTMSQNDFYLWIKRIYEYNFK